MDLFRGYLSRFYLEGISEDFISRVSLWILFKGYHVLSCLIKTSRFYLEDISVDSISRVSQWILFRGYFSRFYLKGISVDFI